VTRDALEQTAMKSMPIVPLVATTLLLVACAAPKPVIRTTVEPSANLNAYRSYTFAEHPGTDRDGYSTPVTSYFKEAIRREMDARGYRFVERGEADLLINFNANAREQVDVRSTPASTYGYYHYRTGLYGTSPVFVAGPSEVSTVRYRVGTANVDVVDLGRKQLVWEGVVEGRLTDQVMKDPRAAISAVIGEMFAQFPGRAT
jgi:hypothetical protein